MSEISVSSLLVSSLPASSPVLAAAMRWSVTLTTLTLVAIMYRMLVRPSANGAAHARSTTSSGGGRPRALAIVLGVWFCVAAAFSHFGPLRDTLPVAFPVGLLLGLLAAAASLASPGVRRAFDQLSSTDVRLLLTLRAVFGGLLLALAGAGNFPVSFGLAAGLGDLAVAWLALLAPFALDCRGSRAGRLVLHGIGLLDLIQAMALAISVVRPWSLTHGNSADVMTLPWVAVPLMVALNVHGIRQAWLSPQSEPAWHGSESAGGVRSAVSGT